MKSAALLLFLGLILSCARVRDGSDLRSISEVKDPSGFPATMALAITTKSGSIVSCTGSFIRRDLMLTSADCLRNADKARVIGRYPPFDQSRLEDRISSSEFVLHPDFDPAKGSGSLENPIHANIGIIRFTENQAPLELVARLSRLPASAGALVHWLGVLPPSAEPGLQKELERARLQAIAAGEGLRLDPNSVPFDQSTLATRAIDASVLYNERFELLGLRQRQASGSDPRTAVFINLMEPQSRSFLDQILASQPLPPPPKKKETVPALSFKCEDTIARLFIYPSAQPPILTLAGSCKPLLTCQGATLEAKSPLATTRSRLASPEKCLEAKAALEKAMSSWSAESSVPIE